ncbi:MAG: carboxymuconolactone decarboxylase family protein [Nibricoccus sp.]
MKREVFINTPALPFHERLINLKAEVLNAFLVKQSSSYVDGAISQKNKYLIAIAISIVINCDSSMQRHIQQALQAGANQSEILEAIEIAIEMSGGPTTVSARLAMKAIDRIS